MGGEVDRLSAADAASALGWWLQAGVDVAIAESPRNWLKAPAPPAAERAPAVRPGGQPGARDAAPVSRLARHAPRCRSRGAGTTRVLPQGQESAPVMLVAEMPAREDAAEGKPIGGEAWS